MRLDTEYCERLRNAVKDVRTRFLAWERRTFAEAAVDDVGCERRFEWRRNFL